jgi:hypothetical protein
MVALLGGLAVIVLGGGDDNGAQPPAPVTTDATATPPPVKKPPVRVKIALTGVGAYDPEGDQSENGGDARLATDGNATTAWKSEHYRTTFGKSGVGVVLDAGRAVRASRVIVTTETPGYDAQVRVGSAPTGRFVAASGSKQTAGRTTFVLKPHRGRYLMLWITSMPPDGVAAVNEIGATAGG